ncbi:MAG: GNAT family N-acetyltransferase, partial [Elusimicrobia bacterium]|nr:GNAT family N-acetyltransferase [Elusimicrobiota bacterium]
MIDESFFIETERLLLTSPKVEDAADYMRIRTDEKANPFLPKKNMTLKQARETMIRRVGYNKITTRENFKRVSLFIREKKTNKIIGWCHLTKHPACGSKIDLYFVVDKSEQGNGHCVEASSALLKYAFTVIKLPEIVAVTSIENIASGKALARLGFKLAGKIEGMAGEAGFY